MFHSQKGYYLNVTLNVTYDIFSCMCSTVTPQLPGDPVHREPLQCPPAEEAGPVPGGDPGR